MATKAKQRRSIFDPENTYKSSKSKKKITRADHASPKVHPKVIHIQSLLDREYTRTKQSMRKKYFQDGYPEN